MTSNQIKAKANKIAEQTNEISRSKLQEDKRANRARESINKAGLFMSVPNAFGQGFGKAVGSKLLNHIEWYNKNATSLANAASLPNSFLRGTNPGKQTIGDPGFICHRFVDTLPVTGDSSNNTSPINLAARALFAINRSHNSGSVNYEAADYMMYIMGIASYIELYAYLIKIYTLATNSQDESLYKQTAILKSYGYNAADIITNVSGLRQMINTLADVLRTYAIPADIPYIQRKVWLVSNTFKDKDSSRAQLHHFVPKFYFHYVDGLLSAIPLGYDGYSAGSSLWTFETLRDTIMSRLNDLLFNESFAIMSGDTKKAFSSLFSIDNIPIDVKFQPIYDVDICNQIRCGNLAPQPLTLTIHQVTDPDSADYGTIYQGSGTDALDYSFTDFDINQKINGLGSVINLNKDNATYEDITRSTRFTTIYTVNNGYVKYQSCGTEILVEDVIGSYVGGVSGGTFKPTEFKEFYVSVGSIVHNNNVLPALENSYYALSPIITVVELMCQFDNAPKFPVLVYTNTQARPRYELIEVSDNNFNQIFISNETLDRINTVAFMSLIGVFTYNSNSSR